MTAHCHSSWTLRDPLEEAPIVEIAACVDMNERKPPLAFAILTHADQVVLFTCALIAHVEGDLDALTEEKVRSVALPGDAESKSESEEEHQAGEKVIAIIMKVIEHLKREDQ